MSRLHEPLQQHIHNDLCSEVNETIIQIKLHTMDTSTVSVEQESKILEARKHRPQPTWEQMIYLLTRIRDEMNECKVPFKRY